MWNPYAEFKSEILPNGLTVHAAHWPGRSQAIGFVVHAGADQDPEGREGLAHFVEHLVVENIPGKGNPSALFAKCGGSVNFGATSWCATESSFFVPDEDKMLKQALSLFGGMLLFADIRKRIRKEREVVLSEFHRKYPFETTVMLDLEERQDLYLGTPLSRMIYPIAGRPDTIMGLTQSMVRSFYDTHYTPVNMSVVSVGGRPVEELFRIIADSPFGKTKPGMRTATCNPVMHVDPPCKRWREESLSSLLPGSRRTVGAYKTVIRIPGAYHPALIRILCSMLQAALLHEVRGRRAWDYDVSCWRWSLPYAHQVEIECEALPTSALKAVDDLVSQCIEALWRKKRLFEEAKSQIAAASKMIDTTVQEVRDDAMQDVICYNRVVSIREYTDALEGATQRDLRDLLQWFRPEQRWVRLIYP